LAYVSNQNKLINLINKNKMKNYQSNQKLVNAFATYQSYEGKANSMYFGGSTIYSYGYHFPIATRTDKATFFNISKYSNTTAKHQSLVRNALSNDNFIECMFVPTISQIERNYLDDTHKNNLNYWEGRISSLIKEIENPRVRNKQTRLDAIEKLNANRDEYKNYFKI